MYGRSIVELQQATAATPWWDAFIPRGHCTKSLYGSSSLFPQLRGWLPFGEI